MVARTCAQLALANIPHTPALHFLELEMAAMITDSVGSQGPHQGRLAEIRCALLAAKTLGPLKVASKIRYEVKRDRRSIEFVHQSPDGPGAAPEIVSVMAPEGVELDAVLATLGFVTYEVLPSHLVTPATTTMTKDMSVGQIFGLLFLLGQAQGLDENLSRMAAMGGIQEFWRAGHARTGKVDFAAPPAEIFDFLGSVDMISILKDTAVEAHGHGAALFSVPDLPSQVLMHLGSNGYNIARDAGALVEALSLIDAGEVTGGDLLERAVRNANQG